ncbi:MAG: class I SAM-dependent methyltransferase [Flavobacteriales bacterium]|nr:MAG: class I SAM-dependent methyltransferase [Flavobacteriales bacterium]
MNNQYYNEVGSYYDDDARDFEKRYWDNFVLQRIRQSFREEVKRLPGKNILEIGFGPGFDLVHFARILPHANLFGLDISQEMVNITQEKIDNENLTNAQVAQGSVEDIQHRFPNTKFDTIYVFFGALNTVEDLKSAASCLEKVLHDNGRMVLTFVNKYYIAGMAIECLKGKFRTAFDRLKPVWGGYSPTKFLASTCYSPSEIEAAFSAMKTEKFRGYSIIYPAWYYRKIHSKIPKRALEILWKIDEKIGGSITGGLGEYTLFVLKPKV